MDSDTEMKETSVASSSATVSVTNFEIHHTEASVDSTQLNHRSSKRRKTIKFLPPREPRSAPSYERSDFETFEVKCTKIPDDQQDSKHASNKNFMFQLEALKHRETDEIWIALTGLLLALGYSTQRGIQSAAKKAYFDSLTHWLHESCLTHPLEMFYLRFGNHHWISKEGFSILIPILNSYEQSNNMVSHVVRHRFKYLELFYEFRLVAESGPYVKDPHNYTCTVCCLEDVPDQFDVICDCNARTHLRCPAGNRDNPLPQSKEERDAYFCDNCRPLMPLSELLERRARSQCGEFEIEDILGYNDMTRTGYAGGSYPVGAYFVKWKNYPLQASEYIELNESFVELAREFWSEQKKLDGGQVYQEKARNHLRAIIEHEKNKNNVEKKAKGKKSRKRGRKRRHGEIEDIVVVATAPSEIGSKGNRPAKRRRVPEVPDANVNCKYIKAKLHEAMSPEDIIREQRFTTTARNVRDRKIPEYRRRLKTGQNRRLNILLRKHYGSKVPKFFLESNVEDHPITKELQEQVMELLSRDWSTWPHDTSQMCFEIGEITDPENPAKKYSDSSIDGNRVFGLFARERIEKGTLLLEYVGVVSTAKEAEVPLDHVLHELDQTTLMELKGPVIGNGHSYWGRVANDAMVIDPHLHHNEAVYMNDFRDNVEDCPDDEPMREEDGADDSPSNRKKNVSFCEINVNGWPHVFAIAVRDIEVGQELLTDYGAEYWDNFRNIMKRQKEISQIRKDDRDEFDKKFATVSCEYESQIRELREVLKAVGRVVEEKCPIVVQSLPVEVQKLLVSEKKASDGDVEMQDASPEDPETNAHQ